MELIRGILFMDGWTGVYFRVPTPLWCQNDYIHAKAVTRGNRGRADYFNLVDVNLLTPRVVKVHGKWKTLSGTRRISKSILPDLVAVPELYHVWPGHGYLQHAMRRMERVV